MQTNKQKQLKQLKTLRDCLASDHVQDNKHRLGALGAEDIDTSLMIIAAMIAELGGI